MFVNLTQFILFGDFMSLLSQSAVKSIHAQKNITTRKRWPRCLITQRERCAHYPMHPLDLHPQSSWQSHSWPTSFPSDSMTTMRDSQGRSTISSGPNAACPSCARPFDRNFCITLNLSSSSCPHTRTRFCPSNQTPFGGSTRAKAARTC